MNEFEEIGISKRLASGLSAIGITAPTDVQRESIPKILSGRDTIVRAKTGTGKTYAFLLPIMEKISRGRDIEALILAPTRELAVQIFESGYKLRDNEIRAVVAYGGVSINMQMQKISRGCNILIGTPGRILDLISRGVLDLEKVKYLVLDEADIMLDMGFIDDVKDIVRHTGRGRQTMFFSATIPRELHSLANEFMRNPEFISVGEKEDSIVNTISHSYCEVGRNEKFSALLAYIDEYKPKKTIIFAETKFGAEILASALRNAGYESLLMHGGLSQNRRENTLNNFKTDATMLVTTNVTARGIDIRGISDVINYDCPDNPRVYLHRVGRSARMGADGRAFSIITHQQRNLISDIEYMAKVDVKELRLNVGKYSEAAAKAFSAARPERRESRFGDRGGRAGGGYYSRDRRSAPQHGNFRRQNFRRRGFRQEGYDRS